MGEEMKARIEFEMPDSCYKCIAFKIKYGSYECTHPTNDEHIQVTVTDVMDRRPEWCPIEGMKKTIEEIRTELVFMIDNQKEDLEFLKTNRERISQYDVGYYDALCNILK
jgi:hypothetical protein